MSDILKCKYCGEEKYYYIKHLYTGLRQKMFVVSCGNCESNLIPIVVDYFMPEEKFYKKCRNAWNKVNAVPNV